MNTKMTGFRWFSKIFGSLYVLWMKESTALHGLKCLNGEQHFVSSNVEPSPELCRVMVILVHLVWRTYIPNIHVWPFYSFLFTIMG